MKKVLIICFLILLPIGLFFVFNNKKIKTSLSANWTNLKMQRYEKYLSNLPQEKPESIIKAKDKYFKLFSLKDDLKVRDKAFERFYDFYFKSVYEINENYLYHVFVYSPNFDNHEKEFSDKEEYYHNLGLQLLCDEGTFYLGAYPQFIFDNFDEYVSPCWINYFKVVKLREKLFYDAWLTISFEEFRNRIMRIEKFIKKYPDFKESKNLQKTLDFYIQVYLIGFENTKITKEHINPISYPSQKSMIDDKVKQSYEKFLKENKGSMYYPLVKIAYKLLEKKNFIADADYTEKMQVELNRYKDTQIINFINDSDMNPDTEKYVNIIWDLIVKELPEKFHNASEEELQKHFGDTFLKSGIYISKVDLRDDKTPEILYVFHSTWNCGSLGCGIHQLILEGEKHKAKYLFHVPPAPIYILNSKTNGYFDLLAPLKYIKDEAGSEFIYYILKFNNENSRYAGKK